MAKYVELNGVRMWYDEQGNGEPLVTFVRESRNDSLRRTNEKTGD